MIQPQVPLRLPCYDFTPVMNHKVVSALPKVGAGQLTGVQDGNFTVRFSVDGGAMTYRVHTDTEDNPFSGGLFSQFGLSDTLY